MNDKNNIHKLMFLFSKLPGLGPRSSRKIILHLLQDKEIRLKSLIDGLSLVYDNIMKCEICGNIDEYKICNICLSNSRDNKTITVVESVSELWAIERSGIFHGKYHVLDTTKISYNTQPDAQMDLIKLNNRCIDEKITEVIIATNTTIEGQTIAYFITEYLKNNNLKISRLANGVPIGGELDYLDDGTLASAFTLRQPFDQ